MCQGHWLGSQRTLCHASSVVTMAVVYRGADRSTPQTMYGWGTLYAHVWLWFHCVQHLDKYSDCTMAKRLWWLTNGRCWVRAPLRSNRWQPEQDINYNQRTTTTFLQVTRFSNTVTDSMLPNPYTFTVLLYVKIITCVNVYIDSKNTWKALCMYST